MLDPETSAMWSRRTLRIALWLLIGFSLIWFATRPSGIFFGDDARLLADAQNGGYASSLPSSLVQVYAGKYRPVFSGLFSVLLPIFGADHRAYELFNNAILSFCAVLLFRICLTLSLDIVVAAACTTLFIISRFAYYAQSQVWGTMESLATLFILLLVREVVLYFRAPSRLHQVLILVWFALLVFTHERFLALTPAVMAVYLIRSNGLAFPGFTLLIAVFNFALKVVVFRVNFFEGQGAPLHFTPIDYVQQAIQLLLSIFGISVVNAFWVGLSFSDMPFVMKLGGVFFAAILIFGLGYVAWRNRLVLLNNRRALVAALLAGCGIVAGAVLLPGLQGRLIYVPYLCLLLIVAVAFGRRSISAPRGMLLACALLVCGVVLDAPFHYFSKDAFLEFSASVAKDAKLLIIDHPDAQMRHAIIIGSNNSTLANFVLNPWYFKIYAPTADFSASFVDSVPSLSGTDRWQPDKRYFTVVGNHLFDITGDVFAHAIIDPQYRGRAIGRFTCLAAAGGRPAETPLVPVPAQYNAVASIVVPPNASCTSAPMRIGAGDTLVFVAAVAPDATLESASLVSVNVEAGRSNDIAVSSIPVTRVAGTRWVPVWYSLARYAGKVVTLRFANAVPAGSIFPATLLVGEPLIGPFASSAQLGPGTSARTASTNNATRSSGLTGGGSGGRFRTRGRSGSSQVAQQWKGPMRTL